MASNERQNARREREEKKNKRNRTVIWIILIIIVAALAVMKVLEIDFDELKNRFTDSNGNFTISATTDVDSYPYTLDSSKVLDMSLNNDKLNILTDSSLTVINPTDAEKIYGFDHGYAEPIISRAGNYFCMIDQGGTRIRLDTNNDTKYESKLDNIVLTAAVAKNGNVVYATQNPDAKSQLVVVSASLERMLTYSENGGYITDVAIDASGKKIAYVTVNSKNAELVSTVVTFTVGDKGPDTEFEYIGTNILDLHYSSSKLYVVGDNCLSVISGQSKRKDVYKQSGICVNKFCYTRNNELVLDYSKYQGASANTIVYVNSSGKVKTEIPLKKQVVNLSVSSNKIVALFDNSAEVYSLTKGEKKRTFRVDEGTKQAVLIGNNLYVHHGQVVDVKE